MLSTDSDSIGTILKNIKDYAVTYEEGSYIGTGTSSSSHPTMISIPRNSDGDIGFGMVTGKPKSAYTWGVFTKYSGYFLNSDGKTSITDAILLFRAAAGKINLDYYEKYAADIDGNDIADITDAMLLIMNIAGRN